MSGHEGQGGIELFNTYLLISGSRQGGQIKRAIPLGVHLHESACFSHSAQIGTPDKLDAVNPSAPRLEPPKYLPMPIPTPKINTASAKRICGVNLIGSVDAILRFLTYGKTSRYHM
jgi:hypothetical protein